MPARACDSTCRPWPIRSAPARATLAPLLRAASGPRAGCRAPARRRYDRAGAGQGQDRHRPIMDLCARRPAVRRAGVRRRRCSTTRAIAAASTRSGISRAMPGSSRPTPMADIGELYKAERKPGRSPRRRAGAMAGASSSSWPISKPPLGERRKARSRRPSRRWPWRRCGASMRSSPSSATINGLAPSKRLAVRQERSAPLVADLQAWMRERRAKLSRATISPRRWTTCSSAGTPSPASSTTAGSA